MPSFFYKAVTEDGQLVRNKVEEINRKALIKKLMRNGLTPITVRQRAQNVNSSSKTKKRRNLNDINNIIQESDMYINMEQGNKKSWFTRTNERLLATTSKITPRDLVVFTQDFYLLKKANFNNIHALTTIIDKTENLRFKEILKDILAGVEAGENMYTTMEYYSDIFPFIYINMIKVGELSGSLTNSLEQAVTYLDSSEALNKKIRGILIPNIAQFVLLMVMLVIGTLVAIPAIQNVYAEMGSTDTLPAATLWFQKFLNGVIKFWYIPVSIIVAAVAGIIFYINTPKGKYNFDYFKYKMPVFGQLIFSLDFSRLMKAMLLNLENGMRIQEAIEVSKNVVQNYVMLSIIETSINNILIGDSWIEPFEKSGLAKSMITEMLKIGMQTDLNEMIAKLVEYMDMDIDNIMQKIVKVLPEVTYLIVGVVLIFFVLVVLAPCIQVYMGGFLFSAAGV